MLHLWTIFEGCSYSEAVKYFYFSRLSISNAWKSNLRMTKPLRLTSVRTMYMANIGDTPIHNSPYCCYLGYGNDDDLVCFVFFVIKIPQWVYWPSEYQEYQRRKTHVTARQPCYIEICLIKKFFILSLWRLVPWINHLPPVCWSTFWKSSLEW